MTKRIDAEELDRLFDEGRRTSSVFRYRASPDSWNRAKSLSTEEFDRIFDEGEEDVLQYCDLDKAVVSDPAFGTRRVNVDFPAWVVEALDREARRIGIGRQAVIKTWIAERLDEEASRRSA